MKIMIRDMVDDVPEFRHPEEKLQITPSLAYPTFSCHNIKHAVPHVARP